MSEREPSLICVRCSGPIRSNGGVAADGQPAHARCLARDKQLESIELQARSRQLVEWTETSRPDRGASLTR
jgi:hypothetical protein